VSLHVVYSLHSVELRELEGQLKAAYVSKAHATQMAEKVALRNEEKAMDLAAANVMLEQCRREEEAERQKELAQYLRVKKYHDEVKRQMEASDYIRSRFICIQHLQLCHIVTVIKIERFGSHSFYTANKPRLVSPA